MFIHGTQQIRSFRCCICRSITSIMTDLLGGLRCCCFIHLQNSFSFDFLVIEIAAKSNKNKYIKQEKWLSLENFKHLTCSMMLGIRVRTLHFSNGCVKTKWTRVLIPVFFLLHFSLSRSLSLALSRLLSVSLERYSYYFSLWFVYDAPIIT